MSFFSKVIQFFIGVECGVQTPQDMTIFYPPHPPPHPQDRDNSLNTQLKIYTLFFACLTKAKYKENSIFQ